MKLSDLTKKPATPDEAEQRIKDLQEEQSKLQNKIETLDGEISNLQNEAGESSLQDALEGTSQTGQIRRKLWNKEVERNGKAQALDKIEGHIQKAEREKLQAQAKVKRDEARKLNDEAESIEKEAEKHLKALRDIQQCEFVPFIRTQTPGMPLETLTDDTRAKLIVPRSETLRRQAEHLINQAEQLESQAKGAKQEKEAVS